MLKNTESLLKHIEKSRLKGLSLYFTHGAVERATCLVKTPRKYFAKRHLINPNKEKILQAPTKMFKTEQKQDKLRAPSSEHDFVFQILG